MQRTTRRASTESGPVEARLIVRSLKTKEKEDKNRGNAVIKTKKTRMIT